jgi:hypothetical protein
MALIAAKFRHLVIELILPFVLLCLFMPYTPFVKSVLHVHVVALCIWKKEIKVAS